MNKITMKILLIASMIFIVLNANVCIAQSWDTGNNIQSFDIWKVGKEFIDLGVKQNDNDVSINSKAKDQFEYLLDFLWGLGLLTIFISTIILGVKYMLVLPEERSRIKQATTPYIGVAIIFGALTIWELLIKILDGTLGKV